MGNKVKTCRTYAPGDSIAFRCPGCGEMHVAPVKPGGETSWQWNGSLECPTLSPSLLIRSGHYAGHFKPGEDSCWCTYNAEARDKGEPEAPYACYICHFFVRDGRIEFLGDCTHKLANQTVTMADIDERTAAEASS